MKAILQPFEVPHPVIKQSGGYLYAYFQIIHRVLPINDQ
jgi:hypothetical protein